MKLLRKPPELIIWFFRKCLFYMIAAECWGHEEIDGWYILGCDPHCPRQNSISAPVLPGWLIFGTQHSWCPDAEDKPKAFLVHSLFTVAAQPNPSHRKKSSVVTVTSQRKTGLTQLEDIHEYWLLPSTNSLSLSAMWYTVSLFSPSRLFLISK